MPNWMAAAVLGPLLNGIIVGMALPAAPWLLLRVLPRSSAATRYAVWSAALVAVTVKVCGAETDAGAVYMPEEEALPVPERLQVTC